MSDQDLRPMLEKTDRELKNLSYNEMTKSLGKLNEANQEMSKFEYMCKVK